MIKDHSDSERGNLLLPHGLLFLITPVVEHWLERDISFLYCDLLLFIFARSHPSLLTKKPNISMTLPQGWLPLDCHQPVELVKLHHGDTDDDVTIKTVHDLFFATMKKSDVQIKSVFRIQNPALWEKYCRCVNFKVF